MFVQVTSNMLENKLREDLERLKKIRAHRGLRHYWGYFIFILIKKECLCNIFTPEFITFCKIVTDVHIISSLRVRGQHTKTTGRRGRTVGVSKKK